MAVNVEKGKAFSLAALVEYAEGSVVSRTILDKGVGNLTVFSFDAGQGLSEHTSPYDAVVEILDGEAEITIGSDTITVRAGELVVMPAGIPHALAAKVRFKMHLIMIREKA
jgi:quercetin dioxygenase-like cupin family protein